MTTFDCLQHASYPFGAPFPSSVGSAWTFAPPCVVDPADIAALAIHLMTNTAITGATFDIDGGQQLVEG